MKKIAFLSLMMVLGGGAFAATYECNLQDIGSRSGRDNFLYVSASEYSKGNDHAFAMVCGHKDIHGCEQNAIVAVRGPHYLEKTYRDGFAIYRCDHAAANNGWSYISDGGSQVPDCRGGFSDLVSLGRMNDGGAEYFCKKSAFHYTTHGSYCKDANLTNGNLCVLRSCESMFVGNQDAINCCKEERLGLAEWNASAGKCQCITDAKPEWNGQQCAARGNGGQGGGYGNGGGNANWNQNWNNNDANAYSSSSSQAGSLSSSESGASATNRNDINNRSGDSKSSAQGGNVGDINIVNVINSCIYEGNNRTTCEKMREEPDCERDYAGFPELIACCIHQKVHLTTFAAGRSCQCLEADMEWDSEARTCMKKTKRQQHSGQTCAQKYASAGTLRIACCNMGNNAIWDGQNCLCGDYSRSVVDPNLEFVFSGQQTGSYCRQKTSQDNHDNDNHNNNNTPVSCYYSLGIKVRCKNGSKLEANTRHMFTFAASEGVSTSAGQTCVLPGVVDVARLMQMFCQESGSTVYDGPDDAAVEAAKSSLQSFFQTAQSTASVWKNDEGKFNTARLASDATAGVVLGTVGGIVSAKVIKKKQLEKGYDVLNCTIGGQKIADWGDEFQVGYSR
ncbi:MAG: hypothetical protein MJ165_02045 [Alphaproteobacteria bacterium]|nr:hypothetical protein [Alphaproteobacteria bacterium]